MIRRLLRAVPDAAKWVVGLPAKSESVDEFVPAIYDVVEVTPAPAPVAPPRATHWSETGDGHMRALRSATCLDCGAPKKVGWYRCDGCREKSRV